MGTDEQQATDQLKPPPGTATTLKTILLYVQDDQSVSSRIEAGLAVARACYAHLSCLHVTPIQAYVAFDSFGGVFVMNDVIKSIDKRAAELQARVQDKLRVEDVTWDYEQHTGDVASSIVSRATLADLIVVGRDPHHEDFGGSATGLLGDLLYRLRSPIFIPGDGAAPPDPTGLALIAWDGSYEAANSVRASIGPAEACELSARGARGRGQGGSIPQYEGAQIFVPPRNRGRIRR